MFTPFKELFYSKMFEHSSNNRNMHDIDAMGRGPLRRVFSAKAEPSVTSPLPPPAASVTNRINTLESELATPNLELGALRTNYDRALIEAAHASNEVDEMRAELSKLCHDLVATQANLDRMTSLFEGYRQQYWPGRPWCPRC